MDVFYSKLDNVIYNLSELVSEYEMLSDKEKKYVIDNSPFDEKDIDVLFKKMISWRGNI